LENVETIGISFGKLVQKLLITLSIDMGELTDKMLSTEWFNRSVYQSAVNCHYPCPIGFTPQAVINCPTKVLSPKRLSSWAK